jgi:hypothetical protein
LEPPVVEKIVPKEEIFLKMEIPSSDQSPRGVTKRGQKTNQRRPRGRRGALAAAAAAAAAATVSQPVFQYYSFISIFVGFIQIFY